MVTGEAKKSSASPLQRHFCFSPRSTTGRLPHERIKMRDAARENMLVDTFVAPPRRDRYRLLLANKNKRGEILDRINHWFDFMPSLASAIPHGQHSTEGVLNLLRRRGLKDMDMVYIISDIRDLDTVHLPLHRAIEKVLDAEFASVVCCVSGRLAYYRPEAPANGYILEIPPRSCHSEKGSNA
jgi:hypothetical protein